MFVFLILRVFFGGKIEFALILLWCGVVWFYCVYVKRYSLLVRASLCSKFSGTHSFFLCIIIRVALRAVMLVARVIGYWPLLYAAPVTLYVCFDVRNYFVHYS